MNKNSSGFRRFGEITAPLHKHANEADARALTNRSEPTETSESGTKSGARGVADEALLLLWKTFSGRYGYKWTRQHGTTPRATWAKDLAKLSLEDVERGLDADAERRSAWPPGSAEFVGMALGHSERIVPSANPRTPRLLSENERERRRVQAHSAIAAMREKGLIPPRAARLATMRDKT